MSKESERNEILRQMETIRLSSIELGKAVSRYVEQEENTLPSINWDHVSPEYKWLAVDCNTVPCLYKEKPVLSMYSWTAAYSFGLTCGHFASYAPGTCDWKDSLVRRPE